jgi:hypothetical protein
MNTSRMRSLSPLRWSSHIQLGENNVKCDTCGGRHFDDDKNIHTKCTRIRLGDWYEKIIIGLSIYLALALCINRSKISSDLKVFS